MPEGGLEDTQGKRPPSPSPSPSPTWRCCSAERGGCGAWSMGALCRAVLGRMGGRPSSCGHCHCPRAATNHSPDSFAGAAACPGAAELSSACSHQIEHLSSGQSTLDRLMLCGLHSLLSPGLTLPLHISPNALHTLLLPTGPTCLSNLPLFPCSNGISLEEVCASLLAHGLLRFDFSFTRLFFG